jgi:hypothetical protein
MSEPSTKLREMAAAMSSTLLLITPHGAQLGVAPFMPAGAGIIELLPAGYTTIM